MSSLTTNVSPLRQRMIDGRRTALRHARQALGGNFVDINQVAQAAMLQDRCSARSTH